MSEPAVGGDLVLAARPATPEAFLPSGRLLYGGDRARMGRRGRVLVALDSREAGPRRVRHLQRYPEAARLVFSLTEAPLAVVVCGTGDRPSGPPAAFRVPGGVGVLLNAGVWHAGPVALADTTLLELLEIHGTSDRLDRKTVADLLGADALRVLLSDDAGAGSAGGDLDEEISASVAADLVGRLRVGFVAVDEVAVAESGPGLRDEADRVTARLRAAWGPARSPAPDVAARLDAVRRTYASVGWDPASTPPSVDALVERVVQGRPLPRSHALSDALDLASLDTLLPAAGFDRARVAGPVTLRTGAPGEGLVTASQGRVPVDGRPVLADREGAFWTPGAEAMRTRVSAATHRALLAVVLPPAVGDAEAARALDRFSSTVVAHCGGEEVARRTVP